jgi:hypothetical protein
MKTYFLQENLRFFHTTVKSSNTTRSFSSLANLIRDIQTATEVAGIAGADRLSQYKSNLQAQPSPAKLDREAM